MCCPPLQLCPRSRRCRSPFCHWIGHASELLAYNADPTPLVWTAAAESILEKVKRGRVALAELTG